MSGMENRSVLVVLLLLLAAASPGCGGGPAATPATTSTSAAPIRLDLSASGTGESLREYVGRQVTVCGHWGDVGKSGTGLRREREGGVGIVLTASTDEGIRKKNWLRIPDGAFVEISGVLRFHEIKPLPPPADPRTPVTQPSDVRFYIDIEEASFRFPKKGFSPRG